MESVSLDKSTFYIPMPEVPMEEIQKRREKTLKVKLVEACKVCDNRCNYCKFACNCNSLVAVEE